MVFSDKDINELQRLVEQRLSEKRFSHTLGVMRCAERLSDVFLKDKTDIAKVAALLHDITKEIDSQQQLSLLSESGIALTEYSSGLVGVIHSYTAPIVIKRDFPHYALPEVLSATYKHTLGTEDMSLLDEIIFLSDFIEEGRVYGESRALYEKVFSEIDLSAGKPSEDIIHRACIAEIDSTVKHLKEKNKEINPKTLLTRRALLSKIKEV